MSRQNIIGSARPRVSDRKRSTGFILERLSQRLLLSAGSLDPQFSHDGVAESMANGARIELRDVAVQPDGKSVYAARQGGGMYGVFRFNLNGTPDTGFGVNGFAAFAVFGEITTVAVQSNGAIVVGGFSDGDPGLDYQYTFTVGRMTSSGGIDPSFSSDGFTTASFSSFGDHSSFVEELLIQRDGKILAIGSVIESLTLGTENFALARFNPNGTFDTSFKGDGTTDYDFGHDVNGRGVDVDYNGTPATNPLYGSIVVVGDLYDGDSGEFRFAVARFQPDGDADDTFDGNGALTTSFPGGNYAKANAVVIQPGGHVVVAGTHDVSENAFLGDFMVVRYRGNGSIDTSFGPIGTGYLKIDFGSVDDLTDMQPSFGGGLILAGGTKARNPNGNGVLAAITADGVLDNRFSNDGLIELPGTINAIATTRNSLSPIRRIYVAAIRVPNFAPPETLAYRIVDVGSVMSVVSFDREATEGAPPGSPAVTATISVVRSNALPTAERVFLSITGTATPPNALGGNTADFTGSGITFGNGVNSFTYIDIPANATSATAILTAVDDALAEGDEPFSVTVLPSAPYDVLASSAAVSMMIRDNEASGPPAVVESTFHFETAPRRVTLRWNQNVFVGTTASDFQLTLPSMSLGSFGFTYDPPTNSATFTLNNNLPDGNYRLRAIGSGIANNAGTPMAGNFDYNFFMLAGDANRDRRVDFNDLVILARNFNQTNRTFSQGDFNYDTKVDFNDLVLLARKFNSFLPSPVSAIDAGAAPEASKGSKNADLLA